MLSAFHERAREECERRLRSTRQLLPWLLSGLYLLSSCATPPEPVVILISIDGFRWDYFDVAETPSLDRLIDAGVKAKSLKPVFPTSTFPNHYTIVTGLYPENHGIVDGVLYDPEFDAEFGFRAPDTFSDGRWWEGEPLWVTVERQGKVSAAMFWGGTDAEIGGVRPRYWHPYDGSVSNETRVDTVLGFFDLPREDRPAFTTLYMSLVDVAGHGAYPGGPETASAVQEADRMIGRLIGGLEARQLFDAVNIVIISDHGMTPTSRERAIFLDDYIDLEQLDFTMTGALAHIWPKPEALEDVYERLSEAHPNFRVFRREEIPERLHFREHRRIPPILAMADEGWSIIERRDSDRTERLDGRGTHGYDNEFESMQAIFVARGPAFKKAVIVDSFENIHIYELLAEILELEPAPNDGRLDAVRHLLVE